MEGYIKKEGSRNGIKKEGIRSAVGEDEAGLLSAGDEGFESEGGAGMVGVKKKSEMKDVEVKDGEEQSSEVSGFFLQTYFIA